MSPIIYSLKIKIMKGGFKISQEQIKNLVTKQAQGFLLASGIGGLLGSIAGGVLCFAIGAFFF